MTNTQGSGSKVCTTCKQDLPLSAFGKNKRTKDGLHWSCKPCNVARSADWQRRNKDKVAARNKRWVQSNRAQMNDIQRDWRKRNPEKMAAIVERSRESRNKARAAYGVRNPEKVKSWQRTNQLRTLYGLTVEQYESMLATQSGLCAICGSEKPDKRNRRMFVDHSHVSGKVRALLCAVCNFRVGFIESTPTWVDAVESYLAQYKEQPWR